VGPAVPAADPGLNTGLLALKTGPVTQRLLSQWWEGALPREYNSGKQMPLPRLAGADTDVTGSIAELRGLQSYFVDRQHLWREGDFLAHFVVRQNKDGLIQRMLERLALL
jgi:hypothetical protein